MKAFALAAALLLAASCAAQTTKTPECKEGAMHLPVHWYSDMGETLGCKNGEWHVINSPTPLEREQHRWGLWNALTTRALTDEEFEDAQAYGDHLNVVELVYSQPGQNIDTGPEARYAAWLQQARLRAVAASVQPCPAASVTPWAVIRAAIVYSQYTFRLPPI